MPIGIDDIAGGIAIAGIAQAAQSAWSSAWGAASGAGTAAAAAASAANNAANAAGATLSMLGEVHASVCQVGVVGVTGLPTVLSSTADTIKALGSFFWDTGSPHPVPVTLPTLNEELLSAINQASYAAGQILQVAGRIDNLAGGLTRYSLDDDGLSAYEADRANGLISGDGLIVQYGPAGSDKLPTLNPALLCFRSPSGDQVYSILGTLVDLLNLTPLYRNK